MTAPKSSTKANAVTLLVILGGQVLANPAVLHSVRKCDARRPDGVVSCQSARRLRLQAMYLPLDRGHLETGILRFQRK